MARQQYSVSLTPEEKAFVQELGGGSISKGLRRAVAIAHRENEIESKMDKMYSTIKMVFAHTLLHHLYFSSSKVAPKERQDWAQRNKDEILKRVKELMPSKETKSSE